MTTFLYLHEESNELASQQKICEKYMAHHKMSQERLIIDTLSSKTHWSERPIGHLLQNTQAGDQIVVYEAAQLACSTSQIIEILHKATQFRVPIHFVKHEAVLANDSDIINTHYLLTLISKIESDFISKRTSLALARRKAAGLPLGRPKGRTNRNLKLDKHRAEISKYVTLGISKSSIAKLVDCHPQTLYDWLERNNLVTAEENSETA